MQRVNRLLRQILSAITSALHPGHVKEYVLLSRLEVFWTDGAIYVYTEHVPNSLAYQSNSRSVHILSTVCAV